jgi:hypothetical protein
MWWWALAVAYGGRAETVQKLLDDARVEDAQKKCEKWDAWMSETEAPLRDVCAEAMWSKAAEADTFATWVRFQSDWAGTPKAEAAFDMEARAHLREIGEDADELAYAGFFKKYGETTAAPQARALQARAAIRGVESAEDARRVAREYPDADNLAAVVKPWFDAFLKVEVDPDSHRIDVKMEPEVRLPGAVMSFEWGVRRDAGIQPWVGAAVGHLDELNVPRATSVALAREPAEDAEDGVPPPVKYPPCALPDLEVGVHVKYGTIEAFVPRSVDCGGADPAFVSVRDGQLVGLTLVPGIDYRFATDRDAAIEWVRGDSRIRIPLLGAAKPEVKSVGPVLGQAVGRVFLVTPLAGGMPWYVLAGPPDSAVTLPPDPVSLPLPDDVRVTAASSGDFRIEKGDASQWTRTLPTGSVRVWSPLLQELTGLHDGHPAFKRVESGDLPSGAGPIVDGSAQQPVVLESDRQLEVEQELGDFRIQLDRAWQLQLGPDPKLEIVFEGRADGRPVKGVLDPKEGSAAIRVFLFDDAVDGDDEVVVFRHEGRTWFGWKTATHIESLHYDGRGLLRSWTAL